MLSGIDVNIVPRKMDERGGGGVINSLRKLQSILQWLYLVVHLSFEAQFCQLRLDLTTEYRFCIYIYFWVFFGFIFFFFGGRSAVRNGIMPSNLLRQWPFTAKNTVSEYALQKDRPTMNI